MMGAQMQYLGDLKPGQNVSVSLTLSGGTFSYQYLVDNLVGRSVSYWDDPLLYRRYELLQALFASDESRLGELSQAYLAGWSGDDFTLPVEVVGHSFSTNSLTFCVYRLPVTQAESGVDVTVGPDLIVPHVDDSTGYVYERLYNAYYFDAGAEAEISFTVHPGMSVNHVDDLVIDVQAADDGSHPPTLAVWNWESDEWDELDFTWGRRSISAAENYVLLPGHVRLRVTADPDWPVDLSSLTITIRGQN